MFVDYALRTVHFYQDGLKLNGTHQLLVYAEDTDILGGNLRRIRKKQKLQMLPLRRLD
jgi:hypothetical protein